MISPFSQGDILNLKILTPECHAGKKTELENKAKPNRQKIL